MRSKSGERSSHPGSRPAAPPLSLRIADAALRFKIETYHLNEAHAALLAAARLHRYPRTRCHSTGDVFDYDADRLRESCVFTTHTPVEAGHDQFPYDTSLSAF